MPRISKRERLLQIAAQKREYGIRGELNPSFFKPIRPKRTDGEVQKYLPARLIVRITLGMKDQIAKAAEQAHMSQAEYGLAILMEMLLQPQLLAAAVDHYHQRLAIIHQAANEAGPQRTVEEWRHFTGWNRGRNVRSRKETAK